MVLFISAKLKTRDWCAKKNPSLGSFWMQMDRQELPNLRVYLGPESAPMAGAFYDLQFCRDFLFQERLVKEKALLMRDHRIGIPMDQKHGSVPC